MIKNQNLNLTIKTDKEMTNLNLTQNNKINKNNALYQ
jgi:hypothetical protein